MGNLVTSIFSTLKLYAFVGGGGQLAFFFVSRGSAGAKATPPMHLLPSDTLSYEARGSISKAPAL